MQHFFQHDSFAITYCTHNLSKVCGKSIGVYSAHQCWIYLIKYSKTLIL